MTGLEPSLNEVLDHLSVPVLCASDDGRVVRFNSALLVLLEKPAHWIEERTVSEWLDVGDEPTPPLTRRSREVSATFRDARNQRRQTTVCMTPFRDSGWMYTFGQPSFGRSDEEGTVEAVVGRFAARLEHLSTTLIESVSSALMEEPPEPIAEALREALAATQEVARIQNEMQSISRQSDVEVCTVSLSHLVRDAIPLMRKELGPDVHLQVEPGVDLDFIEADPDHLQEAFVRLARFSSRFLPPGSTWRIRVQGSDPSRSPVRLVFLDDGPGLPPDRRGLIKDPYDDGSDESFDLAAVHGIVAQHHGRVLVESEKGAGTRFHMEFAPADVGENTEIAMADIPRGDELVLTVDDDDKLRSILVQTLTFQGYRVLEARNGVEASVLLRRHLDEIGLLLIDAVLPGRSGLEIIAEARALRPDLAILLISGYSRDMLGRRAGDNIPMLAKPFGPATLARRIRKLLDEGR